MKVVPFSFLGSLSSLSDDELLKRLAALLKASRRVEAVLVAHIGEVDARRLYAREPLPSMFAYCTDRLGLSEPEAYLRITAARAARIHPVILEMLADGRLHLSGIALLAPHLHPQNATALLAGNESVAEPARPPARVAPAAKAMSHPEPLAPDRFRIQFTATAAFCERLDRLRDLVRDSVPDGGLFAVFDRAVRELLDKLESRKYGQTTRPRARGEARVADGSRRVPSDVRRAVFARDEGRCRFVGPSGARCPARRRLEFHHVEPYARGGAATLANIQLMCRPHNAHLAERDFGAAHMERFRKGPEPIRPPPPAPSRA
jgi:5-methylcytosine-specific restriction endonuclease McrA